MLALREIESGIVISMVAIAAVTGEGETLTMTEGTTARAGLRRVERTDELDYNPSLQGLVFDKTLELSEGPRVVDVVLLLADLSPLSDVGQVFHDDDVSWLKALNNPAADDVVQVADDPLLLPREPFEHPLGRRCAFRLESSPLFLEFPHCQQLSTPDFFCSGPPQFRLPVPAGVQMYPDTAFQQ